MADTQLRTAEVTSAQANPNIFSNLSGAPTQSQQMQAPPMPTGASSLPPELMAPAQQLSSQLYGGGFISGAEAQKEAAMQQLFQYDRSLEAMKSPFPTVPGYVQNPLDTYRAAGTFTGNLGQTIGSLGSTISTTERAYQDAVSATLGKLVDYLTLQETRKQKQEDTRQKELERQFEREKFEREQAVEEQKLALLKKSTKAARSRPLAQFIPGLMREVQGPTRPGQVLGSVLDPNAPITKNAILQALTQGDLSSEEQSSLTDLYKLTQGENNPAVAAYADQVRAGKIKITSVPTEIRNDVMLSLAQMPEQEMTFQQKVDALEGKEKTDISNYAAALADLSGIQRRLEEVVGQPTFFESLTKGTTGPIAGRSPMGNEAQRQLRADIDRVKENIRKDLYGTSFTATEKAESALPGSKIQEEVNRRRITSLMTQKQNELRYRLKTAGWSDEEIDAYISEITSSPSSGGYTIVEEE